MMLLIQMYHMDLNFFAVLNFRGFGGSTAIHESLVLRIFRPALTGQWMILMNSDIIILQNGYRDLGRSEHQCGVVSNHLYGD